MLTLGLWLSGGLHLDGVMDTGDGLAAGPRSPRRDGGQPHRGQRFGGWPHGAAAQSGGSASHYVLAPTLLIWSAVWGRVAPLLAIAWFPYLRAEGSGGFIGEHRQPLLQELLPAAAVLGLLIGLSLSPPATRTVLAGLCGVIPTLLVPRLSASVWDGHTGIAMAPAWSGPKPSRCGVAGSCCGC